MRAHQVIRPPEKRPGPPRAEPVVPASVVGKIGEAAVAVAFSPVAFAAEALGRLKEVVVQQTERSVASMGVVLDNNAKRILNETVDGLVGVRSFITEEYGDVEVIGRGACKNGPFPGEALPDFVALSPKHKQPILIEVKNSQKPSNTDRFQARFYNTVARETGVVVHEQRFEAGNLNLIPVAYHESITETLLVYPRGSSYERIENIVDMKSDAINEIWRAKQLGFQGKSPHTDCGSKCPHHRIGELPEGNLEPSPPLPLVYALGLVEADADLDTEYLRNYFFKSGLGAGTYPWIFGLKVDEERRKTVAQLISKRTGIPSELAERMAFARVRSPDSDKIFRSMASEIEPWEKILGKSKLDEFSTRSTIQGLATRYYTLPEKSNDFVKRSWNKWK
jgi:hypothetical protein